MRNYHNSKPEEDPRRATTSILLPIATFRLDEKTNRGSDGASSVDKAAYVTEALVAASDGGGGGSSGMGWDGGKVGGHSY